MKTEQENEWREEFKKALSNIYFNAHFTEGEIANKWDSELTFYLLACRARQSEIDEACKEKKTYIELLDFLSSRNLVVENKKLKAELEKARELIREELENRGIKFKNREDLWDKKAKEFLKGKE